MTDYRLGRRGLLLTGAHGAAGLAGAAFLPAVAHAESSQLAAHLPSGFTPFHAPGKVVKVTQGNDLASLMQRNLLFPKPEVAREMLERAMTSLTGGANLIESMRKLIHPDDVVAVKVNGIAGPNLAVAAELIAPVVEAILGVGVPAARVTVYEQYPNFLSATRITSRGLLPAGVQAKFHSGHLATMPEVEAVPGIKTRYARFLTEATAVINLHLVKDHSICGYTGAMKNMTHGSIVNPERHHANHANPQIALLWAHPVIRTRVRVNIADGFKMQYDGGPLDKKPSCRILHGAVYASTDPVAIDTVGWRALEDVRRQNGLRSLEAAGRAPAYLRTAAELGLGVHDPNAIRLQVVG